ncbi:hypothetical protein H8S95_06280 [Pontibacter sp. KCTC 32443]|uniref:hypothetical protein n=1 Tax=Pontibacter TaxID=323449 RepID=UPI00164D3417|nr:MULTISPECIES: hypothetical protein [Pontibacter]MBC5773663.1 hypothetical protein [Pontibacter sp. KCTC 32443]
MARQVHFTSVSPDAFTQLKDKLKQLGLSLQGNEGNINEKGVKAKYNYNPEQQSLQIDDLSVGFPASMMVNENSLVQRMTQMVEEYGGRSAS